MTEEKTIFRKTKISTMKQHLSALEICNYVYGGLLCLGGLIPLIYVIIGGFLSSDLFLYHAEDDFPKFIGPFMIGLGLLIFFFVETWGILNILSGRLIANRKGRIFSLIIAGFNCLSIPIGLALGVFTFVTLLSKEVEEEYRINEELLTNRAH